MKTYNETINEIVVPSIANWYLSSWEAYEYSEDIDDSDKLIEKAKKAENILIGEILALSIVFDKDLKDVVNDCNIAYKDDKDYMEDEVISFKMIENAFAVEESDNV